jgi:hypothetical protein
MCVSGQTVVALGILFLGSTPHECIVESWINRLYWFYYMWALPKTGMGDVGKLSIQLTKLPRLSLLLSFAVKSAKNEHGIFLLL